MKSILPKNKILSNLETDNLVFSIVIPTWNNLDLIKNCVDGIVLHSKFKHQIIIIVNEGKDDTFEFFEQNRHLYASVDVLHFEENIGICYALNAVRSYIKADKICYVNDDMYFLPDWDVHLMTVIDRFDHQKWMVSATMIEPLDTGNNCNLVGNYGRDLETFDRNRLLSEYVGLDKHNWSGSSWPPMVVPLALWDIVGGLSVEFSPGMYSDPDFAIKCWQVGVREFVGVGKSLVYHFGSKSTSKVKKNPGRLRFVQKWGLTAGYFNRHFLKLGEPYTGPLPEINISKIDRFIHWFKRMKPSKTHLG
jgi:glycosyltransferase involved in cell wall biosynthesis